MEKEQDVMNIDTQFYQKLQLHEKDGYRHILVLNGFSAMLTGQIECDTGITVQLDLLLTDMQRDGYHLHDVKISPIANPAITGSPAGYCITIIYE